jgi:signal transduction histidine kinase
VAIGLTFAVNVVLQLPAAPVTMNDVIAVFLLSSAVPLLAGLLRRRHVQAKLLEEKATALQREQRERAAEAVAEERARIARELHDVVAHGVSVMVVQAEAGDAVFESDPTTARDALKAIQGSGREALTDLRRMLGVLREAPSATTAPQPSLARVGELVAQLRSAGMDVELRIEGARAPLPRGLDMAAFRIVQEALTNVLKHAGPVPVRVSVRYEPHALELEVVNDGRPLRPTKESGHGLTGIAERVAVFGGVYEAGPQAEGGFRLRVQLPLSPAS